MVELSMGLTAACLATTEPIVSYIFHDSSAKANRQASFISDSQTAVGSSRGRNRTRTISFKDALSIPRRRSESVTEVEGFTWRCSGQSKDVEKLWKPLPLPPPPFAWIPGGNEREIVRVSEEDVREVFGSESFFRPVVYGGAI